MNKKVYKKPSMMVYDIKQPTLLAGSYNHDVGYIPGINNDEKSYMA